MIINREREREAGELIYDPHKGTREVDDEANKQ